MMRKLKNLYFRLVMVRVSNLNYGRVSKKTVQSVVYDMGLEDNEYNYIFI